jgi:uncharacterized protein YjbJ (UPF0337 family)
MSRLTQVARGGPPRVRAWNAVGTSTLSLHHLNHRNGEDNDMDKDRIEGSFEQAKGKVKEVAGKATGDSKLETEGKAQQVAGKVQNTVGGMKDAVKEAVDK